MRVVCVGVEAGVAEALGAALHGDITTVAAAEFAEGAADIAKDAAGIVIAGDAFAQLRDPEAIRGQTVRSAWMLLGDAAAEALYAGVDAVLDSDSEPQMIADELWRAVSSRRDAQRWPKGFIERRVVIAAPATTKLDAVTDAGLSLTRATDAGLLTALRRADHHAAVVDARATHGSLSKLIRAILAYDPSIGVAAVVQTNEGLDAARRAGASIVRMGALGGDGLKELAERAWLAWCEAQPDAIGQARIRVVGNVGPVEGLLATLPMEVITEDAATDHARPEIVVAASEEAAQLDGDHVVVAVDTGRRSSHETMPVALEVDLDVDAAELTRTIAVAERMVRARAALFAVAGRLHEVDARRVALLEKLADAQLAVDNLATLDGLTETLNKRGLEDALLREIEHCRRAGGTLTGCIVEVDDAMGLHQRHGLRPGDDIVQIIADRLKHAMRVTDSIGRIGEDSFLMLMPQTRPAEAVLVATRAKEAVEAEPIVIDEEPVSLRLITGVAVLPWETETLDDAVRVVRSAVEERRTNTVSGPPRDTMVDQLQPIPTEIAEVDELLNEILGGGALAAVAQPIVRVSDEAVVGYEMLTRGREGLYEAPQKLLHFARHRGMLSKVDLKCMDTCLDEATPIAAHLLVCFNLFPTTLLDIPLAEVVERFGAMTDRRLCLELSEEQFVGDPHELLERVAALRSAGVKLAVDDVGKGRGTLDSVMLLEPDIVKIDKELITGASRDTRKERLLRRLVALATTLGCQIVGEGVEKREDLALLRELDVPYAQGFLWARPKAVSSLPPSEPGLDDDPWS